MLNPPAPTPRVTPLGPIALFRVLASNPLEAWTARHFEKPIVMGGLSIGRVAVVSEPAAIRRVLLENTANDKKDWCAVPTNGSNVWYFSYVNNGMGYINYYTNPPTGGLGIGYVITMAYNSKIVNNLPVKDSPVLNEMLTKMTDIVKTLQLKQK